MAETARAALFSARGFRTYLLAAFGGLAVTLVVTIGYAHNRRLEQALTTATDHELRLTAESLTQQLDDAVAFHTLVLEAFAALIEANAPDLDHDALKRTLFSHSSRFGEIGVFYVANAEDIAVFSDSPDSRGYSIEGTWYGDREYVRDMKKANDTVVGGVQLGRRTGAPGLPLATPLHRPGGAAAGYIAETLRLDQFQKILRRAMEQVPEGRAVLLDTRGRVIALTDRTDSAVQPFGVHPLFTPPVERSTLRSAFDEAGQQVRVATHRVPRLGWHVYVMQPTSVVERQLAAAGRQTLVGAGGALLLALVAARLLAALLARPVTRLAEYARSARTDAALATSPAPEPWAPAEVQQLYSTLREMVGRMQLHARDLEEQVDAR
ncbi:MAG: cache domain-containing protein, partial [Myxococcaceae bacterium]|nr:cache domain-containing protein [Myxococcaceae bacterium]